MPVSGLLNLVCFGLILALPGAHWLWIGLFVVIQVIVAAMVCVSIRMKKEQWIYIIFTGNLSSFLFIAEFFMENQTLIFYSAFIFPFAIALVVQFICAYECH